MTLVSPSSPQRCCRSRRDRSLNQHPVQQARRRHRQRRHGADEHGHAGGAAREHPEPRRHGRPARAAALRQHRGAEQSRAGRGRDGVRRRGPRGGESLSSTRARVSGLSLRAG